LVALVIESGPIGRDPFADIDRRVTVALEALPGVVAAIAWLREAPNQRSIYVAMEPGAEASAILRATRRILRRTGVSIPSSCIHIASIDERSAP
jgi:hypothetical protein